MKNRDEGWLGTVAVSVSDAPDLASFGLSEGHLRDAMATVAAKLLALGYRLAYGGDLRPGGFTEQLFELVGAYDRSPQPNCPLPVTDYLAWPVHATMPPEEKQALVESLRGVADLAWLSPDGQLLDPDSCDATLGCEPDEAAWVGGLSAMRRKMVASTSARLVLGGQVDGYKGAMPGIAEEVLLAMDAGQPVYLLGGFGGCTRDIAESLGLVAPCRTSRREWEGRGWFADRRRNWPDNGLSQDENRALAATPHIDEAVLLALTGLRQVGLAT